MAATGDTSVGIDSVARQLELVADSGPDGAAPMALFCENETNLGRLYGVEPITPYPKDGVNDHVVHGAATVNPERTGTKCAFWYKLTVQPGQTVELRLRLRQAETARGGTAAAAFGAGFDQLMAQRRSEADEFYGELTPKAATADEAMVMRQASAGCCGASSCSTSTWTLAGRRPNPARAAAPAADRASPGGGTSMRSTSCQCPTSGSTPGSRRGIWGSTAWRWRMWTRRSRSTLILLCREWFQHPNGALPAYEWEFGDVNPPVQAWAALEVLAIDGRCCPGRESRPRTSCCPRGPRD